MTNSRKIIRVFLASPGDLQEERQAIRNVVQEHNDLWANDMGYQVDLIGWEETVAGHGRPQHLINKDLDRCDLFIGMIWKRWGTPPGTDGVFSSGFEEEFERSIQRCKATGTPEISLFFKQIADDLLLDPGQDLQKVMGFKEKVSSGKEVLYQNFGNTRDIEGLVRKCIAKYVNTVKASDTPSDPEDQQVKRTRTDSTDAGTIDSQLGASPLSPEGFSFLEELVKSVKNPDSLDSLRASDIARFRLLANSLSKPGNDEMNVGVHDLNILYAAQYEGLRLGKREVRYLVRLGFQRLDKENVPLWTWYSKLANAPLNPAIVSSHVGVDEDERSGAITVLTSLGIDISLYGGTIKRATLIASWFSDEETTKVRLAALGYLSKFGIEKDVEIVKKEYERSDYGTSGKALECLISILIRATKLDAAIDILIESQFDRFDPELLQSALSGFEGLITEKLLRGLEHRNAQIRLQALVLLRKRNALEIDLAKKITEDSNVLVRHEAIKSLLEQGQKVGLDEVKRILTPPTKQPQFGLLLSGGSRHSQDVEEEIFKAYEFDYYKSLPEDTLIIKAQESLLFDDASYFALSEKYFRKHGGNLRRNIDDKFDLYFENRIQRIKIEFGDDTPALDLVSKSREMEHHMRKHLTRRALDILCSINKPEDIERIRANLRDGYAGASKADAIYLRKHGTWADIPLLVSNAESLSGSTLLSLTNDNDYYSEVAKALISMSKRESVSDLLAINMPVEILKQVIALCPESRFSSLSLNVLLTLLNHESESVRKAVAVMAVRSFNAERLKTVLKGYVSSENYRYYNVIHWLDLGASIRRRDAKNVARATIL